MLSSATREYLIAIESKTERGKTPALPMPLPLKVTPRLYRFLSQQPILLGPRFTRSVKVIGCGWRVVATEGRKEPEIVLAQPYSFDSAIEARKAL
jgi:hypothetical protein